MDVGTLGAISTVLVTIAFFGVCYWAFSPRLKKRFEEDAKLPFADETENKPDETETKHTDDHQSDDQEGRN